MITTRLGPRHTPSPTTWTIRAGCETYRIRTSSARTALHLVAASGGRDPEIVGLDLARGPAAPNAPRPSETRFDRLRKGLLPEAIRRRDAGESITSIAAALHVPRETLRDWLLLAGAA